MTMMDAIYFGLCGAALALAMSEMFVGGPW